MTDVKQFYFIVIFILSVLTVLPMFNLNDIFKGFTQKHFNNVSSVWCLRGSNETKICKFKNICYNPSLKTLLFFLTKETIIKGLLHPADLQNIQLSSLHHNQFYANLSTVIDYHFENNIKIEPKVLLLSRFKPNNIMHVVHDDLFPVYLTLEQVCAGEKLCIEDFTLVFHDKFPSGPFFDFYKLFSKQPPLLLNQLSKDFIYCFEEMLVGLLQDSIFYQYGFGKPQGPLKTPNLAQTDVFRFRNFVKGKLNTSKKVDIVVISRSKNRKILNVNEIVETSKKLHKNIYSKTRPKTIVVDLNNNNILKIIQAIFETDILIGMHGAEMIFSLLMKPNSTVIEFFPYAIQPEIVSFVKPLAEIKGSCFNYIAWKNMYKNNSISYPNAHPLFGGISYLDEKTQEKIKNIKEVPPVECCNNPVYLHHMYQDSWIKSDFDESIYTYFKNKKNFESDVIKKKWFFPNIPRNISCSFRPKERFLDLKWLPPFNVEKTNKLLYSLYIKHLHSDYHREILTRETSLQIEVEKPISPKFQVWISVLYNNSKSSDFYFECF